MRDDDIFVMVSAHQGYISHLPVLDRMATRIEREFPDISRIVIFPKRYTADNLVEGGTHMFVS